MKLIVEHREYDWTHPPLPDMWYAHYYCDCGWTAPDDGTGKTKQEAIEAAYLAATRTKPNKPLTREQVEAMPDLAAVWEVKHYDDSVWLRTAKYMVSERPWATKSLYYSAPPAPADIEAARKEREQCE